MKLRELSFYYRKFKFGEDNFHNLMPFRIRRILLISTFYDAYIFEHDSLLSDQLVGEYHQLNLTSIPRMISVPGAEEALDILEKESFDIVITTMRTGETSCFDLAADIKTRYPEMPVVLLLTNKTEIPLIERRMYQTGQVSPRSAEIPIARDSAVGNVDQHADPLPVASSDWKGVFDEIFLWTGGPRIFLSIIKNIEDYRNVRHDIRQGLVRVLLIVEDSVEYSSIFLPVLYTELMEQIQTLIAHEQNNHKKYLRMRTRPKILLARSFEEALTILRTFEKSMLGVITDGEFPVAGRIHRDAWRLLYKEIQKMDSQLPVLYQSMNPEGRHIAEDLGIPFINKKTPRLKEELRGFLRLDLGFGDFIFRSDDDGDEIARARTVKDFVRLIPDIPGESLMYHARRDHFSTWLRAHGEFEVARLVKQKKHIDYQDMEDARSFLIESFLKVRRMQNHGNIVDFSEDVLDEKDIVVRLGKGSIGGKGRGLAFMNALISTMNPEEIWDGMEVLVPRTFIIATDVFDEFIESNELVRIRLAGRSDDEIRMIFASSRLPVRIEQQLEQLLRVYTRPLAVRSSSLLEDSQAQPFSGVYETYMIPNADDKITERLEQLLLAIKLVYASAFLNEAVLYIENLRFSSEEEKMAVVIQELAGERYGDFYYPHMSGVGQSWNYYPIGPMSPSDKVCSIAMGLGHMVVGGSRSFMFSPDWPKVPYHSLEDSLKYSQSKFFGLNLSADCEDIIQGEFSTLKGMNLRKAEQAGALKHLAVVYDQASNAIRDDLSMPGPRLLNFRGVLEYEVIPLSEVMRELIEMLKKALGTHVEIEFAVVMPRRPNEKARFYLLQVRPLNVAAGDVMPQDLPSDRSKIIYYSDESLGNGRLDGIRDVLLVDPDSWDHLQTEKIRWEIAAFNQLMKEQNRPYVLIGPGRWGSRDRFLGVPVQWPEISMARVLVELAIEQYDIDASQGSHFLHNIIAMNVGYAHIGLKGKSFFSVEALSVPGAFTERTGELGDSPRYIRHFQSAEDLGVALAGKSGESIVYLPG
jgi:hypothetical protein